MRLKTVQIAIISLIVAAATACASSAAAPDAAKGPSSDAATTVALPERNRLAVIVNGVDRPVLNAIIEGIRTVEKRDVTVLGLSDRLSYSGCRNEKCKLEAAASFGATHVATINASPDGTMVRVSSDTHNLREPASANRSNRSVSSGKPVIVAVCEMLVSAAQSGAALLEGEEAPTGTGLDCATVASAGK